MAEKYEVVKSLWHNHIGIVKIKTLYFGYKYYIGLGAGLDQEQDEQKIARNGMPVNKTMIIEFFKED
jgi:hypothetical protein